MTEITEIDTDLLALASAVSGEPDLVALVTRALQESIALNERPESPLTPPASPDAPTPSSAFPPS